MLIRWSRWPESKAETTAVRAVGAALLCSLGAQSTFFTAQHSQLTSDLVCWALLCALLAKGAQSGNNVVGFPGHFASRSTSSKYLWAVATSLVIACLYEEENGVVELLPLLTPLFVLAQTGLQYKSTVSNTPVPDPLSPLLWGSTLCALVVTLSSSERSYGGSTLSILAVVALLLVYIAFLPKYRLVSRHLSPLEDKYDTPAPDLCWRVVILLVVAKGLQILLFGLGEPHYIHTLLLGVAKAFSWFFLLHTRRNVPWCVAPATRTFCLIAAYDPFSPSAGTSGLFIVVTSGLALAQIIRLLPTRGKWKHCLWAFLLASLAPYLAKSWAVRGLETATRRSFTGDLVHPVDALVDNAKASTESFLGRQSRSYVAACNAYRQRYSTEPPAGFEDWYHFATAHQSPVIDDFDTIYRSVSPFWRLSGPDILQIMDEAQAETGSEIWSCVLSNTGSGTHCHHAWRKFDRNIAASFDRLIGRWSVKMPNVKFLVNHLDEPRTLISSSPLERNSEFQGRCKLTDMSRKPVWDAITGACPSSRNRSSLLADDAIEASTLLFLTNVSSAMDLCRHSEYSTLHGHFTCPTSFRLFEGPVPILSTGSFSTMSDMLYPSPAYLEPEFQYNEASDPDWKEKKNNIYWAGSTTGGYASNSQWRSFHRQRFVALAQNLERKCHVYLRDLGGVVTSVASNVLDTRLFDVAFTRIFQCSMKSCREQKMYFRTKPWADKHEAFRSRLTFDMDGNGISGRYYQLLASKSVVLKQTLLREWHDDRLIPWAHYIPISQSMEELPELVLYLTTSRTGQQKAKQIADLGRHWHSTALREIDRSIYVYRLLLEIARLQDPTRQAMMI